MSENITFSKNELRKTMRLRISEFVKDTEKATLASETAVNIFLESDYFKNSQMILTYISGDDEISTFRIIAKCLLMGKAVAVPRIIPGTNNMDFYTLEQLPLSRQTEVGSYGIVEPLTFLHKVKMQSIPVNSLMLIPGLAFSTDGKRLGKGKGFYDLYVEKLLEKNSNFSKTGNRFGFCFSIQLEKNIPVTEHDILLTHIITEKGITKCSTF